jgi:hypothetical protein
MRTRARASSKSRAVSTISVLDAAKADAGVSILRPSQSFAGSKGVLAAMMGETESERFHWHAEHAEL